MSDPATIHAENNTKAGALFKFATSHLGWQHDVSNRKPQDF